MSTLQCSNCGDDVTARVSNIVTHSSCRHGCHGNSYTATVVIGCSCAVDKGKATELDSIEFQGSPPEGWTDD